MSAVACAYARAPRTWPTHFPINHREPLPFTPYPTTPSVPQSPTTGLAGQPAVDLLGHVRQERGRRAAEHVDGIVAAAEERHNARVDGLDLSDELSGGGRASSGTPAGGATEARSTHTDPPRSARTASATASATRSSFQRSVSANVLTNCIDRCHRSGFTSATYMEADASCRITKSAPPTLPE